MSHDQLLISSNGQLTQRVLGPQVSIHAPREGSDHKSNRMSSILNLVSIHAPREGSDYHQRNKSPDWKCFNPRSP